MNETCTHGVRRRVFPAIVINASLRCGGCREGEEDDE